MMVENLMSYEAERQYLAAEANFNVKQLMAEMAAADERDSFKTYTIEVRDEVRVVRTDPEYADMDNPRGEVYGTVYFLRAVNPFGYTRTYFGYDSEAQAMNAFLFGIAPSVDEWFEDRPFYGSIAYQLEDTEYTSMMEEREMVA
jgi:hypothetical protein